MPNKQSSTLRKISDQAEKNYGQHERFARYAARYNTSLGTAALSEIEALPATTSSSRRPGETYKDMQARRTQGRYKGNLEAGAGHYKLHQGEYFELGVKLADLDDVKIRVEQPFTVGEKVEVDSHYNHPDMI